MDIEVMPRGDGERMTKRRYDCDERQTSATLIVGDI